METPRPAIPKPDCNHQPLLFQDPGVRQVVADFSDGYRSRDGGALLLRQIDRGWGLTRTLAQAFTHRRDPRYCDHTLAQLLTQRDVFGPSKVLAHSHQPPRTYQSCNADQVQDVASCAEPEFRGIHQRGGAFPQGREHPFEPA